MARGFLRFALLILCFALAGCGDPGTTPPMDGQGRYVVQALDSLAFDPAEAKVPVGATVVWRNDGTVGHDVSGYRGDPPGEDHPSFTSGLGTSLPPGAEFPHRFTERGVYTIWCHTHHEAGMKQLVHVT